MPAPTTTKTKVQQRLMDTSTTNPNLPTDGALEEAITNAVIKFSQDRPRLIVADVTGNGTPYYILSTVLSAWVDEFSRVEQIEYPASAPGADYVPSYLQEADDWEYYATPSNKYLRLKTVVPAATETLRVTYSTLHTHTTVTDTVPSAHLDALCDLAAHFACMALATKMAGSNDPLIKADSVNYRDSQLKYSQQAKAWLDAYNDKMGISGSDAAGGGGAKGASATADWDRGYQTGLPFLTHWGRRR